MDIPQKPSEPQTLTFDRTVSSPALPAPSAAPPARLTIAFPRALAAAVQVSDRPLVVGRCGDVAVCHPTVSRVHLAIAWSAEAGAHLVRDLDSRNGSMLDGAPLTAQPRPLRDGSVLRIGDVLAIWECCPAVGAADHPGICHATTLDAADRAPVDLPASPRPRPPIPSRDEFVSAFAQFGGSVRALARHFGRERRQIYRWIQAHGVPR